MKHICHWSGPGYYRNYFKDGVEHWVSVGNSALNAASLGGQYFESLGELEEAANEL